MKNIEKACKMALDTVKNYTWDKYCELCDYCTENEIEFFHNEEEGSIYIEDYRFDFEN